jgi:hypothetical protein
LIILKATSPSDEFEWETPTERNYPQNTKLENGWQMESGLEILRYISIFKM